MTRMAGPALPEVYRGSDGSRPIQARHIRTGEIMAVRPRPAPREPDAIIAEDRMGQQTAAVEQVYPALRKRRGSGDDADA